MYTKRINISKTNVSSPVTNAFGIVNMESNSTSPNLFPNSMQRVLGYFFAPIGISFSFHFGPSDPTGKHRNTGANLGRFREGRWNAKTHWFRRRSRSPPCGSGPGNPHYIKIYGCAFFVVVHDLGPRHGGDPECKQSQAEPPRTPVQP
jgi:hypothetical protein